MGSGLLRYLDRASEFAKRVRSARFEQTSQIAVDGRGVYFTDSNNQRIRRINPDGTLTTIAGDGAAPSGICAMFNPVNEWFECVGGPFV
jgi:streptogramin lyase